MMERAAIAIADKPSLRPARIFLLVNLLVNPAAGNTDLAAIQAATAATWGKADLSYTIYPSRPEDDLAAVVRGALEIGYTHIVAAGGDGTFMPRLRFE